MCFRGLLQGYVTRRVSERELGIVFWFGVLQTETQERRRIAAGCSIARNVVTCSLDIQRQLAEAFAKIWTFLTCDSEVIAECCGDVFPSRR
jgi:hypothetical protein